MYSGIVKPITDQMQTDLKGLVDAGLSGTVTFNLVDYDELRT